MDAFEALPVEFVLIVLESCGDFASLDGLLQISPRAEQLFNASYKSVTEHVLRSCPLSSERPHNHFTLLLSTDSTTFTPTALLKRLDRLLGDAVEPISILTVNSVAAVHQALRTAAKVQLTACAFLHRYFNQLKCAKPRLSTAPTDERISWVYKTGSFPEHQVQQYDSWLIHPYELRHIGHIVVCDISRYFATSIMPHQHAGHGLYMI
ncbi:hypothetical protein PENANT_c010G07432 [Penicillium antarcticum]|uniref:Uncharacterized protein n=1 Tax=Penicillium antarcticum TaxID=416450 RepID=A0A1V6Q821_9EURO|nr:hypothetical protein PENANT_c010G07432 [Penicillium antarcticum]